MTARAKTIARAEDVPATYTKLAEHLYNLVTREGHRLNAADVPVAWDDLQPRTRMMWVADAANVWKGKASDHHQQWARVLMVGEVHRLKGLL